MLVVERGPVSDSWASRVPLFSSDFASDGTRTIRRTMVAQKELIGKDGKRGTRTVEAYMGGVLGGSSRINQMLYTRGLPAEYNAWEEREGIKGWSWDSNENGDNGFREYFLKSERSDVGIEGVHSQDGEYPFDLITTSRCAVGRLMILGRRLEEQDARRLLLSRLRRVSRSLMPVFCMED